MCILFVRPSVMESPFAGIGGSGAAGPGDTRPLGACRRLPREPGSYRASSTPQAGLFPTARPGSSWRFPSLTAVEPPAVRRPQQSDHSGRCTPASSRSPAVRVYRWPGLIKDSVMGIVHSRRARRRRPVILSWQPSGRATSSGPRSRWIVRLRFRSSRVHRSCQRPGADQSPGCHSSHGGEAGARRRHRPEHPAVPPALALGPCLDLLEAV